MLLFLNSIHPSCSPAQVLLNWPNFCTLSVIFFWSTLQFLSSLGVCKSLLDTSLIGFQLFLIADDSSAVIRVVLNLSASVFAREIHHTLRIYVLVKMCIGIHMRNTSHTMITCSCKDVHRYSHEKMTCPVLTEAERRFFIGALRQFLGSYNHRVCFNQTIPQNLH